MSFGRETELPANFFKYDANGSVAASTLQWARLMEQLKRYEGMEMLHRGDVWEHARRVHLIGYYMCVILKEYGYYPISDRDIVNVSRKAWHHDDEEPGMGEDIPTPIKLAWSQEQKETTEARAALAQSAVGHFILGLTPREQELYLQDREELRAESTIDAQIVKVADKLDAFSEKLHEVRCGNWPFLATIELSRTIIGDLDRFDFWKILKYHPVFDLDTIPTVEEIGQMPILHLEDFTTRDELHATLTGGLAQAWPLWYRSWLEFQWEHTHPKDREKMILPGWYMTLWEKWGIPADVKTSRTGVRLHY